MSIATDPTTEQLIADAAIYESVAAQIVAAEDAGDDFESFRLIEQEGEPQLQRIDSQAQTLAQAVEPFVEGSPITTGE